MDIGNLKTMVDDQIDSLIETIGQVAFASRRGLDFNKTVNEIDDDRRRLNELAAHEVNRLNQKYPSLSKQIQPEDLLLLYGGQGYTVKIMPTKVV